MIVQAHDGPEYSAVVDFVKSKTAVTMTKIARHATTVVLMRDMKDRNDCEYNKELYGAHTSDSIIKESERTMTTLRALSYMQE